MKANEHSIASCIRIEQDPKTGSMYLVFEIHDPGFKKKVKEEWSKNIEFKLKGFELVKNE